ncbi:hypothetical protein [Cellulomonas sp. NPDC089187]|uniref:hypothetical protein n=1 Tax=Cellulomonas sp. NPDC089187 TaxID=3154970 RepID=UPI00342A8CC5
MHARQSTTTRVDLPAAHRGVVAVTAEQAADLYRALRELDQWQRASALDGAPVDIEQECRTQTALLMVELIAARGGEISAELASVLAALGLARLG